MLADSPAADDDFVQVTGTSPLLPPMRTLSLKGPTVRLERSFQRYRASDQQRMAVNHIDDDFGYIAIGFNVETVQVCRSACHTSRAQW